MIKTMNRRCALLAAASLPVVVFTCVPGCGRSDPDRFVSGTLVKPLDFVERADEEAAKKFEANSKTKRSKNSK